MPASHEFEEHVGEVALALRADGFGELFAEAGRALAELMIEGQARDGRPAEHVEVCSRDRTSLLVDWLNELIFIADARRIVLTDFEIERISDTEVVAEARGVAEPPVKTAVKAATLHEALVTKDDAGYRAYIVLDV